MPQIISVMLCPMPWMVPVGCWTGQLANPAAHTGSATRGGPSRIDIGEPLAPDRQANLKRNLTQLVVRGVPPAEAVRLLVKKIEHTHHHGRGTAGGRVLTFCIPRLSAERHAKAGFGRMVNMQRPVEHAATFGYFDGEYDTQRQHAPTLVCGEFAAEITSIETMHPRAVFRGSPFACYRPAHGAQQRLNLMKLPYGADKLVCQRRMICTLEGRCVDH